MATANIDFSLVVPDHVGNHEFSLNFNLTVVNLCNNRGRRMANFKVVERARNGDTHRDPQLEELILTGIGRFTRDPCQMYILLEGSGYVRYKNTHDPGMAASRPILCLIACGERVGVLEY